jgi:signal transduction histidine kinase
MHRSCRTSHFRREAAGLEPSLRCALPTIVVDVSRCRCSSGPDRQRSAPPPERDDAVLTGAGTLLPMVLGLLAAAAVGAVAAWLVLRRRPPRQGRPSPSEAIADAEFGTLVSHDLRAPIRVVEGFTRIVKEDYAAVLGRVGLDHLDRVLGAAARMNHMIDALLSLSRLSSQPLTLAPVDLSLLAGYIVEDLRRLSPDRQVEVEIEPGLAAEGDPTLLRMVLENLLGNAWKYTGNTEGARIAFRRHPKEPATFTVRDNGAGFDMRFADRLFGAFQRLHSASEFPGTGIGLASVRRIVRRHGGEIRAEGEPERGASFHFSLPG